MKSRLKNGLSIMALMAITFFSCESEETVKPDENNNQIVDQTAQQVLFQEGINSLTSMDDLYGSFEQFGFSNLSNLGRKGKSASGRTKDDDTCALVTIKENTDGSYSLTLDFGNEGCVDDGNLVKGVVTFTGYETDSSGTITVEFEDFSEEPVDGSEDEEPFVINGSYEGRFEWNPDAVHSYLVAYSLDIKLDYEDGKIEEIDATGQALGNDEEYVVTEHTVEGTNNFGDRFYSEVLESLVYDFSCEETDIYTSGIQRFEFNEDSATVDYGEGACDNILTITAPGITIIIDLDEYEQAS